MEGESEALGLSDVLGEVEALTEDDVLELGLCDEDGDIDALGLPEALGDTEAETLELGEVEADGDVEALLKADVTRPNNLSKTAPVTLNSVVVPIAPAPEPPLKVIVLTAWIDQSGLVTGSLSLLCCVGILFLFYVFIVTHYIKHRDSSP